MGLGKGLSAVLAILYLLALLATGQTPPATAPRKISGNAQNASHALGNINQYVKEIAAR